ncbi:MAG: Gfo/Idh/MocA family oxidoreductase [Alphaproteobacteria bacterium]|nr:Gfo/Idh/MocA family oxidoreductase [Alphaproteobacteria bacterium]
MAMPRIALIGLGLALGPHVASLMDLSARAEVAVGFSRSASRREAFAAQTGLPASDDLDAIFANPAIDTVAILTPPASHLELVGRACAASKSILLEMPLDITIERSERLVAAVERTGVTAAVMLQHRFKPPALRLCWRRTLDGVIGVSVQVPLLRPRSYYDVDGAGHAPATAAAYCSARLSIPLT